MGLKPLWIEVQKFYIDWMLRNAHPLCPDVNEWVLRRRRITTGRWY